MILFVADLNQLDEKKKNEAFFSIWVFVLSVSHYLSIDNLRTPTLLLVFHFSV
jgi:hypothetical protein